MKLYKLLEKIIDQQEKIINLINFERQEFGNYLSQINQNTNLKGVAYQIQKETYELAEDGKKLKKIKEILT